MSTTLVAVPSDRLRTGLAILRIVIGIVFVAHGAQKLFVFGIAGVTAGFAQMGIPMPGISAPLVALVEFLGGIALIVGLLTRLAAVGLAIDMLGAIMLVHLKGGFFMPSGIEFALTLLAACIAIAVAGPGALAVDTEIAKRRAGAVRV